jgi:hypothetical protein
LKGEFYIHDQVRNTDLLTKSFLSYLKKTQGSQYRWLMPVILATWEAQIKKIMVPCQSEKKKFARPQLSRKKLDMVVYTCHPS